jgi:5-methylcytosine-specific restriction endonuclease McrA
MRAELAALHSQLAEVPRVRARNSAIAERIYAETRPLYARKSAIESNRKSVFGAIFSGGFYSESDRQELQRLDQEITRKHAAIPKAVFPVNGSNYNTQDAERILQRTITELTTSIGAYERALVPHVRREERLAQERAKKEAQKQRIAELRAAAATVTAESRELAAKLRRKMAKQGCCPYCGGELGDIPHADHIYPVSKGGRSVERNLVFVCSTCNVKKSKLTLAAFIRTYQFDRDAIEARLTAMGKDF